MLQVSEKAIAFLSYARGDEEQAEKLYQGLLSASFSPLMASKDILPGKSWDRGMTNHRRGKDVSKNSFHSTCLSAVKR